MRGPRIGEVPTNLHEEPLRRRDSPLVSRVGLPIPGLRGAVKEETGRQVVGAPLARAYVGGMWRRLRAERLKGTLLKRRCPALVLEWLGTNESESTFL